MRRRTLIASAGAILGTSVGAAAYTSATVSRTTTFTVAADSGGARIGLVAGTSSGVTGEISDGTNQIDISLENLNTGSTFTFGDASSIGTKYAFKILNNASTGYDITVSYTEADVTFDIFVPTVSSGTESWSSTPTTSVAKGSASSTMSLAASGSAGDEVHVLMSVTTGKAAPTNGTLTIDSVPTPTA